MLILICGALCVVISVLVLINRLRSPQKCAYVVTLGDIGRSPRMQFHSLSLAHIGYSVYIFGYGGSVPYPEVVRSALIHLVHITPFPAALLKLPRLVVFALKVIWQTVALFSWLLVYQRPSHILLQNPPSLPTIAVCWLASRLHGSCFIVDWHNYGYTILRLQLGGDTHPLVVIHKLYERLFGRFADKNICVTDAMREDLMMNWNLRSVVTMHDRPAEIFRDLSLCEQHEFYRKLDIFQDEANTAIPDCVESTVRTLKNTSGLVSYREDRPAVLVSGTSWTEDEDFSILLHALDLYDEKSSADIILPRLICVITGKGPMKEHYQKLVRTRSWSRVEVFMPWLEAVDYPKMLASADLGVCLHKSSSGLDLPMKVVDMFGCRLPVCAVNFSCLHELVQHDRNGMVFDTEHQLSCQLQELLLGFPQHCNKLNRFRENLKQFQRHRWQKAWTEIVSPLFI